MYSNASAASRTSRNTVMRWGVSTSARSRWRSGRECDGPDGDRGRKPDSAEASGVFQHDLHDDIAGVAAAVDRLLHHLIKLLQDDQFLGVVRPVIKILQQREHDLVGLALG